jgi:hypothetical protein
VSIAIPVDLQPLWVGDSNTAEWLEVWADRDYYDRLVAWLRSEGFDEKITHRVEVYLLDVPFAKVFQYVHNGADSVVRTALLSSLPPARVTG